MDTEVINGNLSGAVKKLIKDCELCTVTMKREGDILTVTGENFLLDDPCCPMERKGIYTVREWK